MWDCAQSLPEFSEAQIELVHQLIEVISFQSGSFALKLGGEL